MCFLVINLLTNFDKINEHLTNLNIKTMAIKSNSIEENTGKAQGNNGFDYCGVETIVFATLNPLLAAKGNKGWYGFVVNEAATITAVTLVNSAGTTEARKTMSWLNHSLGVGMYCPAGIVEDDELFISSITVSAGSILTYIG